MFYMSNQELEALRRIGLLICVSLGAANERIAHFASLKSFSKQSSNQRQNANPENIVFVRELLEKTLLQFESRYNKQNK